MQKYGFFLLLLLKANLVLAATTGRGGLFFGKKSLNSSDWGELDSQPAWGIHMDIKDDSWPAWMTLGYYSSRDEVTRMTSLAPVVTTDLQGKTAEIQLGLKKDFTPLKKTLLSLAAGPAHIHASLDNSITPYNRDSDSALGFWVGADVIFFLTHVSLGISYKFSKADVDLLGQSVDAGGKNLAFSVGFGW